MQNSYCDLRFFAMIRFLKISLLHVFAVGKILFVMFLNMVVLICGYNK